MNGNCDIGLPRDLFYAAMKPGPYRWKPGRIIHITYTTVTIAVPLCPSFLRTRREQSVATVTRYRQNYQAWDNDIEQIPLPSTVTWPSFATPSLVGLDGAQIYLHVVPILSYNEITPIDVYASHWDESFYGHDSQLAQDTGGRRINRALVPDKVRGGGATI